MNILPQQEISEWDLIEMENLADSLDEELELSPRDADHAPGCDCECELGRTVPLSGVAQSFRTLIERYRKEVLDARKSA